MFFIQKVSYRINTLKIIHLHIAKIQTLFFFLLIIVYQNFGNVYSQFFLNTAAHLSADYLNQTLIKIFFI